MWGYAIAGRSPVRYENFLRKTGMEIVPLTKSDADDVANFKPIKADLLDALIAASARRRNAIIWTADKDFLKFLPKDGVRIF
jgi:PIN domain nuclease of toxin-antitoxin system